MLPKAKTIRCLSVRQPYADEIIFGTKRCENRTWFSRYRGPLYIHASRWDGPREPTPGAGRTGAIIGRVELIDIVPIDKLEAIADGDFDRHDQRMQHLAEAIAEFTPESWQDIGGPFCWILADPEPLAEPIPAKGKLNVWRFDLE